VLSLPLGLFPLPVSATANNGKRSSSVCDHPDRGSMKKRSQQNDCGSIVAREITAANRCAKILEPLKNSIPNLGVRFDSLD
jgi:hypothetical protein